jgi:peptidoglycan/LPS O-acetylase OafA/YrhL
LAALTVVFYHFTLICSPDVQRIFFNSPLRILIAGHQAVILFFLLSGFVLTLPYAKRSSPSYGPFLLKRFCRIYLPYLGALVLAVVCDHFFRGRVVNNVWISHTWAEPITAKLVIQHILFLGNYDWSQFNTAFWSLVYEMRISLVFPLIALAVLRFRAAWSVLLALSLSLAFAPLAKLFSNLHLCSNDAAVASMVTLHFAAFFILGSLLAKNLHQVDGWYKRLHLAPAILFALVAFVLYGWSESDVIARHLRIRADYYDWGVAAGAIMIMILAMNARPFHAFLTSRLIHHLGEISYSLYLVHGTVLFTLIHTCLGRISMSALLVLYLAITLAITEIFYRLVERPTMLLGRRLTAPRPLKESVSSAAIAR